MTPYVMRAVCPHCGNGIDGRVDTLNGQDRVFCLECGEWCYNAPRTETGREVRSLRTRPDIKPAKRARVLERDNGSCVLCHRSDVPLDVGHLISVAAGRELGLTDTELYDEENLAAMCAPCNSGLSAQPVNLRFAANVLRARLAWMEQAA